MSADGNKNAKDFTYLYDISKKITKLGKNTYDEIFNYLSITYEKSIKKMTFTLNKVKQTSNELILRILKQYQKYSPAFDNFFVSFTKKIQDKYYKLCIFLTTTYKKVYHYFSLELKIQDQEEEWFEETHETEVIKINRPRIEEWSLQAQREYRETVPKIKALIAQDKNLKYLRSTLDVFGYLGESFIAGTIRMLLSSKLLIEVIPKKINKLKNNANHEDEFLKYFQLRKPILRLLNLFASGYPATMHGLNINSLRGDDKVLAMRNYMLENTPWAQILQQEPKRFDDLAYNLSWDQFINTFIPGIKLNYLYKILTANNEQNIDGQYFLTHVMALLNQNISFQSWDPRNWVNAENLGDQIIAPLDIKNLLKNEQAQILLIEALFPLLKRHIFKHKIGKNISIIKWSKTSNNGNHEINLREVIINIRNLLLPEGQEQLSHFIKEIIDDKLFDDYFAVDLPLIGNIKAINIFRGIKKLLNLDKWIIHYLHKGKAFKEAVAIFDQIIEYGDIAASDNLQLDVKGLAQELNLLLNKEELHQVLEKFIEKIQSNETSIETLKRLLTDLGFDTKEKDFKHNSHFLTFVEILKKKNGAINNFLNTQLKTVIENLIQHNNNLLKEIILPIKNFIIIESSESIKEYLLMYNILKETEWVEKNKVLQQQDNQDDLTEEWITIALGPEEQENQTLWTSIWDNSLFWWKKIKSQFEFQDNDEWFNAKPTTDDEDEDDEWFDAEEPEEEATRWTFISYMCDKVDKGIHLLGPQLPNNFF